MKLCEVYAVKTSAGTETKWVVVAEDGNGQPEVIVVGSKDAISIACEMLHCDKVVGMGGAFSLDDFLSIAKNHGLLRRVKNWEPFGLGGDLGGDY